MISGDCTVRLNQDRDSDAVAEWSMVRQCSHKLHQTTTIELNNKDP